MIDINELLYCGDKQHTFVQWIIPNKKFLTVSERGNKYEWFYPSGLTTRKSTVHSKWKGKYVRMKISNDCTAYSKRILGILNND